MSFGQTTPSWDFDSQSHIIDTNMVHSALQLNQENINMFNNQQPAEVPYHQPYGNIPVQATSSQFPDCEVIDSILFDPEDPRNYETIPQDIQIDTSNESSPNLVNSMVSPQTSDTSGMGGYETKVVPSNGRSPSSSSESDKPTKKSKSRRQLSDEQDAALIARDDSELTEEELQLKRKAQNRAAQRAFRERKQTKLKELEAKLLQSEEERQKLVEELNLIKKQNISISTENEILRSSKISQGGVNSSISQNKPVTTFNFPQNQDDFIERIVKGTVHHVFPESKNKVYDNDGDKLLALGAVWDYLQIKAEEANLDFNSIDINEIMETLRGHERCHGFGPAYPLDLVNQAIQSSLHQA
ncbi:uncharacterized protein SPAPADRAFT_61100 [Spathaspora passalidarum NRRL Y-27907]|uniref:BZIP domain-containing protein n=1 Tax=Spathaspora passalidarum (strain NRRL Y-27907 / 11-Y1) TaxID=619300 RepID=G3ANQ3_SPAPN|nr:uncharacterized protein SPAPADRAFT_61100 [Spathaspora passalidarum NRRL Y-27907]EGW31988.1 hypothetical protein SPAPADRAFT_61100 [Spathaspora passalidarum NRRL Y-27907]